MCFSFQSTAVIFQVKYYLGLLSWLTCEGPLTQPKPKKKIDSIEFQEVRTLGLTFGVCQLIGGFTYCENLSLNETLLTLADV